MPQLAAGIQIYLSDNVALLLSMINLQPINRLQVHGASSGVGKVNRLRTLDGSFLRPDKACNPFKCLQLSVLCCIFLRIRKVSGMGDEESTRLLVKPTTTMLTLVPYSCTYTTIHLPSTVFPLPPTYRTRTSFEQILAPYLRAPMHCC